MIYTSQIVIHTNISFLFLYTKKYTNESDLFSCFLYIIITIQRLEKKMTEEITDETLTNTLLMNSIDYIYIYIEMYIKLFLNRRHIYRNKQRSELIVKQ